ncbi:unnamed protein product [Miscanthus lutarioriparius]|uniref:Plant heme peroxidase family profile domain-containing protein n=1 Tax=Miscanthus lutarioriparius TaxID=422564 RepID=A0A811P8G3_9POAL|nr:unnamed protein product [Miscanthus lutarioriparius]
MAATSSRRPAALLVLVAAAAAVVALAAAAGDVELLEGRYPPLAPGLSFDFYKKSCPKAESIVRDFLSSAVRQNVGLAAALIRLHFHDCFNAFFQQFVYSYVKMGQINVLTGSLGQVRANCSARNAGAAGDELPWSVVETVVDAAGSLVL